jgi:hypothetical protein
VEIDCIIDALYIANAVIAVPLPPTNRAVYFTAHDAFATFVFEEDGTWQSTD